MVLTEAQLILEPYHRFCQGKCSIEMLYRNHNIKSVPLFLEYRYRNRSVILGVKWLNIINARCVEMLVRISYLGDMHIYPWTWIVLNLELILLEQLQPAEAPEIRGNLVEGVHYM